MGVAVAMDFPMTLDEFLHWDDGTDTRYELINGRPVAMAPPRPRHGAMVGNAAAEIGAHLRQRRPCQVIVEAGIVKPNDFRSFFVADLAVSCTPADMQGAYLSAPTLIVEALSPSTRAHDLRVKIMVYRALPTLREIVLIDTQEVWCEVHRRLDETRWQTDLFNQLADQVTLESIGYTGRLEDFYAGLGMEDGVPLAESDGTV